MNQRRWIAVIIALGLCVVSLFSLGLQANQTNDEELNLESLLNDHALKETIVEKGDSTKRIAQITVDGTILNSDTSSLLSQDGYNHQQTLEMIQKISQDDTVKAVFLKVNSPGGGTYESSELARALTNLKKEAKLPIYVSMQNMAASGGYYISANADKIFASEETTTGSIGVIMSSLNYADLLAKLGIKDQTVKSGALKDIGSSTREQTEQEQKVLQEYINRMYERFVDVVAKGRHMDKSKVKQLADGRIYDGSQAKELGLVDEIGYSDEALAALREDYDLVDAEVFTYSAANNNPFSKFFSSVTSNLSTKSESQAALAKSVLEAIGTPKAPKAMYYYGG
ncbi:signal peptide peptidase SppA [Enterococcus columbae]|uniref:Signal peptide peptidase SppA, 36K type n=1 Tax=Enterococcus columbae DSM 7374 = ATCC 51263 TaxID=1121865 RepID=S0KFT5_9ENTE|nr:signal peptide peptidase SppA [Enterococcus columbae]EOT43587.1 signal peptide peptidase SppA, 36K type [Enterococcus columbae DSM 7374 = ATCC 51263]EOW87359.1 signal peptide peptidase SppA, 36K type [Enterococcus columbae DSM 7374 = ATCC 51263]